MFNRVSLSYRLFIAVGLVLTLLAAWGLSVYLSQPIEERASFAVEVPAGGSNNQATLTFKSKAKKKELIAYVKSLGGTVKTEIPALNSLVVELPPEKLAEVQTKPAGKNIAAVEKDQYVVALEGSEPNDPLYNDQWGMRALQLPQTTVSAAESTVAVIDSGVCFDHPDLEGVFVPGWDFVENDAVAQDEFGHGCSVVGVIAAKTNNSKGIAGVVAVKIMPLRVLDAKGAGTYSNLAAAIVKAADARVSVINLSLGGSVRSDLLEKAVNYATLKGVKLVAAAGNSNQATALFPAKYASVVAVGAVDQNQNRATFSNYGSDVDVWAPGVNVLTTTLDNNYKNYNGTSFAAPFVSGWVAAGKKLADLPLSPKAPTQSQSDAPTSATATNPTAQATVPVINNNAAVMVNPPCNLISTYKNSSRSHSGGYGEGTSAVDIQDDKCTDDKVLASISGKITIDTLAVDSGCPVTPTRKTNSRITITNAEANIKVVYLHQKEDSASYGIQNGQDVAVGTPIATISNIGCASGEHIHFEVYENNVKLDYTKWKLNHNIKQDQAIGLNNSDNGIGAAIYPTDFSKPNVFYLADYINNKTKSLTFGTGICGYFYDSPVDDFTLPTASNPFDDYEWSIISPWYWTNTDKSKDDLQNIKWHREGLASQTYNTPLINSISTVVTGRPCNAGATATGLSALGLDCFNGPFDQPPTSGGDNSQFVSDVTIPDGTDIAPHTSFTKIWRIKNIGSTTWNTGYRLAFQSGYRLGGPTSVNLNQSVAPGQTVDVAVNILAPATQGTYRGNWILQNDTGQSFGMEVFVLIDVVNNAPPPSGIGQVKLFSAANYTGILGSYGIGQTNAPAANSFSMEIPSGWSVRTYKSDGLSGEERCWYDSISNLQDHGWQTAIQSLKVYDYNDCGAGQKAKLFALANYQNQIGAYDLGKTNAPNRDSFSLELPAGWSAKVYMGENQTGADMCYNASQHDLTDTTWNLKIESMELFSTDVCPSTASYAKLCRQTGGGDCVTFTNNIPSLGQAGFGNDIVKSVRVTGGWDLVLFEDDNYQGRWYQTNGDINDLGGIPFGYGASSIQLKKVEPLAFTLYKMGDFNDGSPFRSDRSIPNLSFWKADQGNWNDITESIRVSNGYEVVLCTDADYHGTCGRAKADAGDINSVAQGLRDGLSSVQVCKTACPATPSAPVLVSPMQNTSFIPGNPVTFAWTGSAEEYYIEVWGGALTTPLRWGWTKEKTKSFSLPYSTQPYRWHVRGWNPYGEGSWSAEQTLYVQDIAPTQVVISGKNTALLNTDETYIAFANPSDASNLNYTWSPAPKAGQGTNVAVYNWSQASSQSISVTVTNSGGSVQTTRTIKVGCGSKYLAQYYDNNSFSGNIYGSECVSNIDFDWGQGGPAYAPASGNGSGADGNLIVANGQIVYTDNARTNLTASVSGAQTSLSVTAQVFAANDEVLIYQSTGGYAGNYEFRKVASVSGNTVTLQTGLTNSYQVDATAKAQILKVPQYKDVTVIGTLTMHAWDGNTGGVLAFRATGTVTIEAGGSIDANGKGFRGGVGQGVNLGGQNGESTDGFVGRGGTSGGGLGSHGGGSGASQSNISPMGQRAGGGGSGGYDYAGSGSGDEGTGGGGGGGNASAGGGGGGGGDGYGLGRVGGLAGGVGLGGGNGGDESVAGSNGGGKPYGYTGNGGKSWGSADRGTGGGGGGSSLNTVGNFLFGSGGGASGAYQGRNTGAHTGKNGGAGGGVILITASKINLVSGNLSANGQNGIDANGKAGGGGGGAGGSIILKAASIHTGNAVRAIGGNGGVPNAASGGGGQGGQGRISISHCDSISGGTAPAASTSQISCEKDNFAIRYTKEATFAAGNYMFNVASDDGVKLILDGETLIDNWTDGEHAATANEWIDAGIHTLTLEYYEKTQNANVELNITITANTLPVFTSTPATSVLADTDYTYQVTATDTDNDPLSHSLVTAPTGMAMNESGLVTWHPTAAQAGEHPVVVQINDGKATMSQLETLKQSFTINVTLPVNEPPEITSTAVTETNEKTLYTYQVAATDPEEAALTYSLPSAPTGMQIDATGKISWTPTKAQIGSHEIVVSVSDGNDNTSQDFTLVVKDVPDQPQVGTISGQTINQGDTFAAINLNNFVSDDDAEETFSWAVSGQTNIQVAISSGQATLTYPQNWYGVETLTFTVTDSDGLTASKAAAMQVNKVYDCNVGQYHTQYFNNRTLTGTPTVTECSGAINYNWSTARPKTGINVDNFSIRWTGYFNFDKTAEYYFTETSNDGARVWVDGVLLIDHWTAHSSAATKNAAKQLTAGVHKIVVEYYEVSGGASMVFNWKEFLHCTAPTGAFCGEYFSNATLAGAPLYLMNAPAVNFAWSTGGPGNGIPVNNFSVRWQGKFNFNAGEYYFTATSDQGMRVWVDSQLVIDDWVAHTVRSKSQFVTLTEGEHLIKVEYYEQLNGATAQLTWKENIKCAIPEGSYCVEYFNNRTLTGVPDVLSTATTINNTWGTVSPIAGINPDNFSARWQGSFDFLAGNYKFTTTSDNGIRVYVDGVLKLNHWTSHTTATMNVTIPITAGKHTIRVEYYDVTGTAVAKFSWLKV